MDAACVRYTKNDLSCTGHPKGSLLEDIIESVDKKLCEVVVSEDRCNNLYLSLRPQDSGTYSNFPEIVLSGGTPPYSYRWTMQQTGGTTFEIGDVYAQSFGDLYSSMTQVHGTCQGTQAGGIPCRISLANPGTDPTHAWHFKLEVTDAMGCRVRDYWTVYHVATN